MSSSTTWTVASSAPSASLQTTSSCVVWSTPKGPGQAEEVGLCEPHEVQQGQVQGAAPGSGQTPLSIQAGG